MNTRVKTLLIISIMLVSFVFSGCTSAKPEMPEIVFMKVTSYPDARIDDVEMYSIAFFDNKGNYCVSDDKDVYMLSTEELVQKFKAGEFEEKINLTLTRDTDELAQNFKKLRKVLKNKNYELEYPEHVPEVVPSYVSTWYGLYYDENSGLQRLPLYMDQAEQGEIKFNDERAAEIYEWIRETLHNNQSLQT